MATEYTSAELIEALRATGIGRGDVVHMHSALFGLGAMKDVPAREVAPRIYQAVREVIGAEGTLTVPTAFEDFARQGTPYDCRRSPVDWAQGAFSQYIASLPEAVRTYCPMSSVTAVGPRAQEICHAWTGSAFGSGSAWEKLHDLDAKLAFLGVRPAMAFTFVVLIQFRFGVPYYYNKIYTTPIFEDGKPIPLPVTSCVRYLNPTFKIQENCVPFEEHLTARELVRKAPLGRGHFYALPSARAVFREGTELMKQNLFYFCKQVPGFVPGEIPMDGPTGTYVPDYIRIAKAENAKSNP